MLFEPEREVNHKIGKVSIGKVGKGGKRGKLNVVAERGRLGRKIERLGRKIGVI